MEFTYTREDIDGKVILHFNGQLAQDNIEKVAALLNPIIQAIGPIKLVIDMANCSYINSRTVAHLALWRQFMDDQKGELFLMALQPQVLDVIHVVGLDQIIKVVSTIEEVI